MKVLLLGYSNIAKRRVIPALQSLGMESLDVASKSALTVEWSGATPPRLFHDYDIALRKTEAELVYISTPNSQHSKWAWKALESGFHVVVDKPAFLSIDETRELINLAERTQRCLAEANVYSFHPQIARALETFKQSGSVPTRIMAAFTFPPLNSGNFRYQSALGGGALWDLGPYAVTAGRVIFGDAATEILGWRLSSNDEVDTSFSMMALYPGGRSCIGLFGYTTAYLNRIDILGAQTLVTIDRVFSPPPNADTELTVRRLDQVDTIRVPPADAFALFFKSLFEAISDRNHSDFFKCMLADARAIDCLRASSFGTPFA